MPANATINRTFTLRFRANARPLSSNVVRFAPRRLARQLLHSGAVCCRLLLLCARRAERHSRISYSRNDRRLVSTRFELRPHFTNSAIQTTRVLYFVLPMAEA